MITRGDVTRVLNAFATQEWTYWKKHYTEWMVFATHPLLLKALTGPHHHLDPALLWDGFRWHYVRCLIRQEAWSALKGYVEGMGETYLREHMQTLIQSVSPRLYREVWGEDD